MTDREQLYDELAEYESERRHFGHLRPRRIEIPAYSKPRLWPGIFLSLFLWWGIWMLFHV